MLYLHNVGCRLDESVIQSIKKWLPSLKYMASSKKAPFLKEDPKYADGQPPLDENSMTLWLRADDLRDNGYNPGVRAKKLILMARTLFPSGPIIQTLESSSSLSKTLKSLYFIHLLILAMWQTIIAIQSNLLDLQRFVLNIQKI